MTLNELIDSLTALREKEDAGECPVMFFREVYLYSVGQQPRPRGRDSFESS